MGRATFEPPVACSPCTGARLFFFGRTIDRLSSLMGITGLRLDVRYGQGSAPRGRHRAERRSTATSPHAAVP